MKKVTATLSTLAVLAAGLTSPGGSASAAPLTPRPVVVRSTERCTSYLDHLHLSVTPQRLGLHWYNLHLSFTTTPARSLRHWTLAVVRAHPDNSIFFDFNVSDFAFTAIGRRREYTTDQIVRNLPGTDHFVARVRDSTHHQACTVWLDVRP